MSRRPEGRGRESVLHRLSGEPGSSLGAKILHHGARILLLLALSALVTVLFPPARGLDAPSYSENMVATQDVIAQIGFSVPKTAGELERDRRDATEAVPRTFDERTAAGDSVAARLGHLFDRLDSASAAGDTLALGSILQARNISVNPVQMQFILSDTLREALRTAGQTAALQVIPQGMGDPAEVAAVTTEVIHVRAGPDRAEEARPISEVVTSRDFYARAVANLPPEFPIEAQDLLRLVLISHLEYSLVPNLVATESDRMAARSSVPVTKGDVLQGEAIVREADPIGPETLERLDAYTAALREAGLLESEDPMAASQVGSALVTLTLLSIFGLLLFFSRPQVYANFRWLTLLAVLTATYFGAALGIYESRLPAEWLPIAFVALPVAVLWDTRMSLLLVLILAAITGTLEPFSSDRTVLVVMVAGAAAAMSVRAVRRRSQTWVSIAIIAAAATTVSLGHALANADPLIGVAQASLAITGNATVSALLAVGFLWVFELFTGITTEQTLLEWADPTRPLLRRLSMEAPGTYAHTINVANLAEAAANEIGANALLCRVGVLYHDVGKMLKPHYFVENQPDGRNPHDKLKPETSASIVREHVTEGVRLAREDKVPDTVVDFILEHHGTQLIGFFYEKAREEDGDSVDPARFSYPGPKPQSKETAIVMLADSCESAARAMRDPTPERMRDLINSVVDGKVAGAQLDEAPLTLGEIARVKEQFEKILGGVVHRRIEYPETKHLTDGKADASDGEASDADADAPDAEAAGADGAGSDAAGPDAPGSDTSGADADAQNGGAAGKGSTTVGDEGEAPGAPEKSGSRSGRKTGPPPEAAPSDDHGDDA